MARPKAFDETEALDAAMACFWERGYEATSVRELTERMGIASPSLYNAFRDKRNLFRLALEQYCNRLTLERITRIEAEFAANLRIGAFLAEVVDKSVDDRQRRGCFLINSAIEVAPHDPELGAVVTEHLGRVRQFFERSIAAAQTAGTVLGTINGPKSADHLMAVLLGIRVLARTRPERELLAGIVEAALTPMGLPHIARGVGRQRKASSTTGRAEGPA